MIISYSKKFLKGVYLFVVYFLLLAKLVFDYWPVAFDIFMSNVEPPSVGNVSFIDTLPFTPTPLWLPVLFKLVVLVRFMVKLSCANAAGADIPTTKETAATILTIAIKFNLYMHL